MKNNDVKPKRKANNIHAGHRNRLKNRFLKDGLQNFEQHNMLELLLFYAIPQGDVNETAHELINRFGSLSAVFDADINELIKVKGVKTHTAILIKMIPGLAREYFLDADSRTNEKAFSIDELGEYLIRLFTGKKTEEIYLLLFDDRYVLSYSAKIDSGDLKRASVNVKTIAQTALRMGYDKVALAHNHPAGTSLPSMEDIDATNNLKRSLSLCGIDLCEHFIVAGTECVGMLDWKRTRILSDTIKKRLNELM